MPIELRSRLQSASRTVGDPATEIQRRANASDWSVRQSMDPDLVVAAAREQEDLGYDGVLIPERSGWPDVYVRASWALVHTQRLKTVAAHRIGRQSPTTTARLAQTLDVMSKGRLVHHFITGHNEQDQRRDGDRLPKADRYARAAEFLEVYVASLTATEPFDFAGEYYQVDDSLSGVGNHAVPYGEISWAGSSPPALEIAARWVDTFALPATTRTETRRVSEKVNALAASHGRSLRFWYNANQIVAETDEKARDIAESLVRELESERSALRLDIDRPESVSRREIYDASLEGDWVDDCLFLGLARVTGVESVPAFVGSPETVAKAMLRLYADGVEIFGLDPQGFTPQEYELKRELVRLLHDGADRHDRDGLPAGPSTDEKEPHDPAE